MLKIKISDIKKSTCEYTCTIKAEHSPILRTKSIDYNNIIEMIDEMPIFCIIATQINGITTINNAGELRNKESDRIKSIIKILKHNESRRYLIKRYNEPRVFKAVKRTRGL